MLHKYFACGVGEIYQINFMSRLQSFRLGRNLMKCFCEKNGKIDINKQKNHNIRIIKVSKCFAKIVLCISRTKKILINFFINFEDSL